METAFGTKNVCRVVWGDSGEEPLPTRLTTDFPKGMPLAQSVEKCAKKD